MKSVFILILTGCISFAVTAQEGRVSESEVKLQQLFLEANTEKLIGKLENALELYKKVLDKDRENAAAYYEISRILHHQKNLNDAIKNIELAVQFDPQNIWYRKLQGDFYEQMGTFDKAALVYEDLISEYPDEADFYYQRAFYFVKNGEPVKALKVYNELDKRIGVDEELSRKKQVLYLSMDKPDKAIEEIEKLVKAFPSKVRYLHMLAGLYQNVGKKEDALSTYNKILQIKPDDGKSLMAVAERHISNGDYNLYLKAITPVVADESVNIDLKISKLFPFINVIATSNDEALITSILETAETLTQTHPDEGKAFSIYGDMLSHAGMEKKAIGIFKQTLELDKSVFTVWEQMFYLYEAQFMFEDLLSATEDALNLFPNKAKAHYFNGIAYAALDNPQKAISAFEQAGMMSRKNPLLQLDILHRLGRIYYKVKQYPRAASKLEKALNTGGEKIADLLELYGDCQFQLGNTAEALDYWNRALSKGSTSQSLKKKIETKSLIE